MGDKFIDAGFSLTNDKYQDLDILEKESLGLIVMKKFKSDSKKARQSGNHLDGDLILELIKAFDELERKSGIDAIILSSGHRFAFSRGAKIEIMHGASQEDARRFIFEAQKLIYKIQGLSKPVVAAINGVTFGGALELAMACDYRISSDRSNVLFGLPEATIGILPAMGGTQNLSFLVGKDIAYEIMTKGRADIEPQEALKIKLINKIVPDDVLITETEAFIKNGNLKKVFPYWNVQKTVNDEEVFKKVTDFVKGKTVQVDKEQKSAPLSVLLLNYLKQNVSFEKYQDALVYEKEACVYLQQTEDCQEGLKALMEERTANFQGK